MDKSKLEGLRIDRDEAAAARGGGRRGLVLGVALLVASAAVLAWWLRPRPVAVRAAVAREVSDGGERTVLNASGYVTARRQATVSSKVTGKVVEVLIEEGMEVREGQVLARLDDANVRRALELAEAELAAGRSALAETKVRLDEARRERDRIAALVAGGVTSERELDRAQAELEALEARLALQEDQVEVSERQVALRRQELEDTIIRAPFAGKVVAKNAQPGEMISPISAGGGFTRTGIGTIVDMDSLEIEVDVNESYINRVVPGQPVTATLDAYPEWPIPARVIAIIPTADRDKATVRVRIGFEELDPRILPDMGVKVAFRAGEDGGAEAGAPRRPRVRIPAAAVRDEAGTSVVFVVAGDRVERRAVRIGERVGEEVDVLAGLAAGERVVVEGPPGLADGQPVRILSH